MDTRGGGDRRGTSSGEYERLLALHHALRVNRALREQVPSRPPPPSVDDVETDAPAAPSRLDRRMIFESLRLVEPYREQLAWYVFRRLFADRPDLRSMFSPDLDDNQRRMVDTIVAVALDGPDVFEDKHPGLVDRLSVEHRHRGVSAEHHSAVGTALLATLRELAGAAWRPEYDTAWRRCYRAVVAAMAPPQTTPERSPSSPPPSSSPPSLSTPLSSPPPSEWTASLDPSPRPDPAPRPRPQALDQRPRHLDPPPRPAEPAPRADTPAATATPPPPPTAPPRPPDAPSRERTRPVEVPQARVPVAREIAAARSRGTAKVTGRATPRPTPRPYRTTPGKDQNERRVAAPDVDTASSGIPYTGTVVARERRGATITVLTVRTDRPFRHQAGQYTMVESPRVPGVRRPYSIATAPGSSTVELHVRSVPDGRLSKVLASDTSVGDQLQLSPPRGRMTLDPASTREVLLVAGGTGLAPIKSLAAALANTDRPARLFFGVRRSGDLYDMPALEALADSYPGLRVVVAVSEDPKYPGVKGELPDVIARYGEEYDNWVGHDAYVAGPPGMVAATVSRLKALGVPPEQIFSDPTTVA